MRLFILGIVLLSATTSLAQTTAPQRGDQVDVRKDDGMPASPRVQAVIAVAGDRLRIDPSGVYVNDLKVTTLPQRLVEILPRENEMIPAGHVFVAGEERDGNTTGRGWNLIPVERVSKHMP